jgi:NAD+ synthase (glutamine-hydrolysing)
MRRLRLGTAQINTTVGDFKGNTRKILKVIADGSALGVDLLTFPELAICGYPLLALSPFSLYLVMI